MSNNLKEDIDFYQQLKNDNFTQRSIDLVEKYVEKHGTYAYAMGSNIYWVVKELCKQTSKLLKENIILRENLFNIEQQISPNQQWENILANKLQRAIKEQNQEHLEIINSIDNQVFIISIQKKYGKTPQQLLQQSEIRRTKVEEKNKNLLVEIEENRKRILQQSSQINILERTRNKIYDPDGELKTRQEIEYAIQFVEKQIKSFNDQYQRKEFPKLTQSMIAAMQEAFQRVSHANFEIRSLKSEIKKLLLKLNNKGVSKSRFGKYRIKK
jgi:hypothetical protein